TQPRPVNGFRPQPLGGEELEYLARAHDVGRANLGDHLRSDDPDDAVEPLLSGARTCHDVAKAAQEAAGTANAPPSLAHPRASCLPDKAGAVGTPRSRTRSPRAASTASAWSTSSSRISAELCS